MRGHFGHGPGQQSRVVKALALLVESGTMYCLLLVSLVLYISRADATNSVLIASVLLYALWRACMHAT